MTHKRWTQGAVPGAPGQFPKNKYSFTENLQRVGDFVRTHPLDAKDVKRFRDAAYFWAWNKGYKVHVRFIRKSLTTWEMEATLTSKVGGRDFG